MQIPGITYVNYAGLAPLRWRSWLDGIVAPELMGNIRLPNVFREKELLREEVAEWLGCQPEQVALVPSTSIALTIAAHSLNWGPGNVALYPKNDFPANIFPWEKLSRYGAQAIAIEDWKKGWPASTRMVSLSTVDYTTGTEQPWQFVCKKARERGIWTVVDAIQSAGVKPSYNPDIDFWCCGTQKWLVSGVGLAVMVLSQRVLKELEPPFPAWLGLNELPLYESGLSKTAKGWEMGWVTPSAVRRFRNSLKFFKRLGWQTVTETVKSHRDYLHEQLLEAGWPVVSSPVHWSGIVSFDPGPNKAQALVEAGYKKRIVTVKRGPYVRLSPHVFNNQRELHRVAQWFKHCRTSF